MTRSHTPNCRDIPLDVRVDADAGQRTDDVGIHKKDMHTDALTRTYVHTYACVCVCVCVVYLKFLPLATLRQGLCECSAR